MEQQTAEGGSQPALARPRNPVMNRLEAMQLFVRVADLGSFAAAAQQLGVSRSMVTFSLASKA